MIDELAHALPVSRRQRQAIERELRAHLEDTRRELQLSGWHPDDALRESLARLGNPEEIVEQFTDVYRPPRRRQLGLALGLSGALFLGAFGAGASFASATSAHHQPASHTARHATIIRSATHEQIKTAGVAGR
jgi:hypothetical protein